MHDRSRQVALLAALLTALAATPSLAQPAATPPTATAQAGGDALGRYRAAALELRISMWSGVKLQRAGRDLELGFFGGELDEILAGSPAALDAASTFRTLRITGTVLWALGLGALVAELALLIADRELLVQPGEIKPLFWGLLIPGAVVGVTGGMLMQGANTYLGEAASLYNRDLAQRLGGGAPGPGVSLGLRRAF